jgi:hypothetical protein
LKLQVLESELSEAANEIKHREDQLNERKCASTLDQQRALDALRLVLRKKYEQEISVLKSSHASELVKLRTTHDEDISKLRKEHEEQLRSLSCEEIRNLKSSFDKDKQVAVNQAVAAETERNKATTIRMEEQVKSMQAELEVAKRKLEGLE